MNHLKFPLILGVLTTTLTACCCPFGSISSLIGQAEFTTGDFADVPAYPGSTQTTESDTTTSAMTKIFSLIAEEAEWKHYTTTDSDSDVLDWYEGELPDHGWNVTTGEELGNVETKGGLIFENGDDPELLLAIFTIPDTEDSSTIHILIGRIRVKNTD